MGRAMNSDWTDHWYNTKSRTNILII